MKPEIFELYASRNLPRYTSYPTAPHFSAEVDSETYRRWLGDIPPGTDLSLYLHIPFCRSMCWYCGCHTTVTARQAPVAAYLEALGREIRQVSGYLPADCLVRNVHFGGGTPTLLRPEDFRGLVEALRQHFTFGPNSEIAIEVDPRNLAPELVGALAASGVKRASLGIQTFDARVQRAINRLQDVATVTAAVTRLRGAGIEAINFDLIYGLPLQSVESCTDTVEQALELEPNRFAVFGYAHVPDFKPHQRKIDNYALPDAAERWAQSRAIDSALVGAGYVRIGLDHYAKPGDSLAIAAREASLHRNFQGYTTDSCPALIGLGASAISKLPQGFAQNVVGIGPYQDRIRKEELPIARGYALTEEDRLRGALIERVMCDHKVDVASVCRSFGADPAPLIAAPALRTLETDGLIARDGSEISVRPDGQPLVRAVAAAFDAHLDQGLKLHSRAV